MIELFGKNTYPTEIGGVCIDIGGVAFALCEGECDELIPYID